MKWIKLTSEADLNDLLRRSVDKPQVIFKYSNQCGLSDRVLARLELYPTPDGMDFYFVDIFTYRGISNKIAAVLGVHHESPQVLLVMNGECVYEESHNAIRMEELIKHAGSVSEQPGVRGLQ